MARKIYFLTFIALFLGFASVRGQNNSEETINQAYRYDLNAPAHGDYRVAVGDDEVTVFFRLITKNNSVSVNRINYEVKNEFASDEVERAADLNEGHIVREAGNQSIYRFEIPNTDASNYIFIYLEGSSQQSAFNFRYEIDLNEEQNFPLTDLLVMEEGEDVPFFENAIPQNTDFRIKSLYGQDSANVFVYYYDHDFPPNLPPMAESSAEVQKSLQIDTIYSFKASQTLSFEKEGLYFCQLDTSSLSGISFRISSKYYPRFVTAESLIDPLRYISTSEEMENLTENEDAKKALDRYWIKITRSQERAKEVIRNYYQQVTNANLLFTSYKEGWKTGQGMVYLLFGPPDVVTTSANQEQWIYNSQNDLMENMTFNFVKVRNIFTTQHYNLLRDEDYRRFWYRNIDLWRKGRKQI